MKHSSGSTTWKVGELAEATGLTVRTLHHWDELGLVVPSRLTAAGHRLYGDHDVRRVYEVVALRELGLSLETIGRVLSGDELELGKVLEAHVSQVRTQLGALRALENRLSALVTHVRRAGAPPTSDLLGLIDEVSKMSEIFRQYFTDEQIAALQERRERLGDEHIAAVENEWATVISALQAEMDAGTAPTEPRVQALAARWMALLEAFDGGDPALREANNRMRVENPDEVQHAGGPSEERWSSTSTGSTMPGTTELSRPGPGPPERSGRPGPRSVPGAVAEAPPLADGRFIPKSGWHRLNR